MKNQKNIIITFAAQHHNVTVIDNGESKSLDGERKSFSLPYSPPLFLLKSSKGVWHLGKRCKLLSGSGRSTAA